jgi:N-acetylglucosamine-6-sulfatase
MSRLRSAHLLLLALSACQGPCQGPDKPDDSGPEDSPVDSPPGDSTGESTAERPMSILLVVTDDQRWDSLWAMPRLQAHLVAPGLQLDQAYVTTPLCCPARGSLFSGGFLPHDSGVMANTSPNGGVLSFDDSSSVAVRFHEAGYRTGMIGKYLNEYTFEAPYIPPGWDHFAVPVVREDWFEYDAATGGIEREGSLTHVEQYCTDYVHDQATAFLEGLGEEPFLLWLNYFAAHDPATPDTQDDDAYDGYAWRGGAFNEDQFDDKPSHMQGLEPLTEEEIAQGDEEYEDAMESLLSVDRSLASLIETLEALGRLEETAIIFTSDNGFLWGEHRVYSKGYPYQESLRVPLVVRLPGGTTGLDEEHLVAITLDVPATLYDIAGIDAPTAGMSLLPILRGQAPEDWRSSVPLEAYTLGACPDYAGLVTERWKYVEYVHGERELYDLRADPFETRNLAEDAAYVDTMAELSERVDENRGLAILTEQVRVSAGQPADVSLEAWGGAPPYSWAWTDGDLPAGLSLGSDGHITGTPEGGASGMIYVQVSDSSSSPYHGGPQVYGTTLWVGVSSGLGDPEPPGFRSEPRVHAEPTRAAIHFDLTQPVPLELILAADPGFDFHKARLRVQDGAAQFEDLRPDTRYHLMVNNLPGKPKISFRTPPSR